MTYMPHRKSENFIVPLNQRGTLNAPSFYLLDQYLKAKSTELFDVAFSESLPVIQTGKYQNLTFNIKVSMEVT